MKKNFGFDTEFNKIKSIARSLWMGFGRGEGELEIENQGRFDQSRFSQETEAIGQQTPRNGGSRSKLRFTQRVSSAGRTLNSDSTPQFSPLEKELTAQQEKDARFPLTAETLEQGASLKFKLQDPQIQFALPRETFQLKATTDEQAAFIVAEKTQQRLAALFRESSHDEDSAV